MTARHAFEADRLELGRRVAHALNWELPGGLQVLTGLIGRRGQVD